MIRVQWNNCIQRLTWRESLLPLYTWSRWFIQTFTRLEVDYQGPCNQPNITKLFACQVRSVRWFGLDRVHCLCPRINLPKDQRMVLAVCLRRLSEMAVVGFLGVAAWCELSTSSRVNVCINQRLHVYKGSNDSRQVNRWIQLFHCTRIICSFRMKCKSQDVIALFMKVRTLLLLKGWQKSKTKKIVSSD